MSDRYDDAVGLQVMRYALESISDEMHQTVVRAARSTNIKDRQDTSSALFALDGKVIAQTEYATPLHLGTKGRQNVRDLVLQYPDVIAWVEKTQATRTLATH